MNKKYILILIFVFIIAAVIIYLYNTLNSDYVFKAGDIKIKPNEYKVYLYEQKKFFENTGGTDIWETDIDGIPAEDVAKQQTINSIIVVKSALEQANKLKIELSDEELKTVKKESDKFYEELGVERIKKYDVTSNDIYKIMKEGQIQKKVFDYITNGFEISDAEFNNYFEENYKNIKTDTEELKESAKEEYIQKKKQEIYNQQSEKWISDFRVEKNDEIFSSIKISDI